MSSSMYVTNPVMRPYGWSVRLQAAAPARPASVVQGDLSIRTIGAAAGSARPPNAYRAAVLDRIHQVPGRHMRGLQRDLGMCMGTLEHHLRTLERGGTITVRGTDGFKSYFPAEGMDRRDRDLLCHLRHGPRLRIVVLTLLGPGSTMADLSRTLSIAPSSCAFHLEKLVTGDVITTRPDGRRKRLSVADPERVMKLLRSYPDTFPRDLVEEVGRRDRTIGLRPGS